MFEDGLKYQESHMSSVSEFIEDLSGFNIENSSRNIKGGPVLYREDNIAYTDSSDSHTLIVGDTGSMKTLRFVLPLIYTCGMAGESMIIVDPKGELARKTESFLVDNEYKTVVLNMRNPQKSPDSWNPMDLVKKSYSGDNAGNQTAILQLNPKSRIIVPINCASYYYIIADAVEKQGFSTDFSYRFFLN